MSEMLTCANTPHRNWSSLPGESMRIRHFRLDDLSTFIDSLVDVEDRKDAGYRNPEELLSEVAPRAHPATNPEDPLAMLLQHVTTRQEPVWIEFVRIRVYLLVVSDFPAKVMISQYVSILLFS